MTAHIHHKEMLQYAQDAAETDKPWERWEVSCPSCCLWLKTDKNPGWYTDHKYRRKPRTIKVNGFDVPEPMRKTPDNNFYFPVPSSKEFSFEDIWTGCISDEIMLSRGLIHSTKEAAAKHAMAMCGIDPATYKDE